MCVSSSAVNKFDCVLELRKMYWRAGLALPRVLHEKNDATVWCASWVAAATLSGLSDCLIVQGWFQGVSPGFPRFAGIMYCVIRSITNPMTASTCGSRVLYCTVLHCQTVSVVHYYYSSTYSFVDGKHWHTERGWNTVGVGST